MIIVGIMAQFESVVPMELPLSVEACQCTVANATSYVPAVVDHSQFNLFQISYMWYPFVGCLLTVLFSVMVSYLDSTIKYRNVVKINNRTINHRYSITEPKIGVDNIGYTEKY